MPSVAHEAPLAVFRAEPELVPYLLHRSLGVDVPAYAEVELSETDLTQVIPAELRADLVLVLRGPLPERAAVMGIVVEVQRSRDERKRSTWPLYLASLHARLACPTCLVVVATEDDVARWAGEPIGALHPGMVLVPFVLGPAQVPRVTEADAHQQPWLAVLSALAHGNRPDGFPVALAAILALGSLPASHGTLGIDLIWATLEGSARLALEAHMKAQTYSYMPEYQSDFCRKHFGPVREQGRAEGRLEAVRELLEEIASRRLGGLSEAQRARITTCEDLSLLQTKLVQVAEATTADAVSRILAGE